MAFQPRGARWQTIGAYLVGLVVIQLVLVLALIGLAAFQDFRGAEGDARATVRATAKLAADYVATDVGSTLESVETLPEYAEILALPNVCEVTTNDDVDARFIRNDVIIATDDGSLVCGDRTKNIASAPWFKEALASSETIEAGPVADPVTGDRVLIYALAFPEQHRVLAITIVLKTAGTALEAQFGSSGPLDLRFRVASADGKTTFAGSPATEDVIGSTAKVPDLGWRVTAEVSHADALAAARRALTERVLFALGMVIIVVAAAMFIQRRLIRPVRALDRVTGQALEGDLSATVKPGGPAELEHLGRRFNELLGVRKKAEAALRKAVRAEQRAADELRDVDAMRQAFLMAISHELRTPLTSVVGYATFIDQAWDDLSDADIRTSVSSIASQSKRLERLLLDLLDIERLSRGIVEPHLVDTELKPLIQRVVASTSAARRIKVDGKDGFVANVDPALFERIVENLVFNAVKHTPPDARIWVALKRVRGGLRLTVDDSGHGVSDDMKLTIFDPFKQGEVQEHAPGTGVGLNLVSQFSKLHGGRVWVEDRPGGGARFQVELPVKVRVPRTVRTERASAAA